MIYQVAYGTEGDKHYAQTVWLKDCDCGVDMGIITSVYSPVAEEIERTLLTKEDVVKDSHGQIWQDKVLVLKANSLKEEYRNRENQLWFATGGFGLYPDKTGTAVFCTCLDDGETSRWHRYDFLGIYNGELTEKEKVILESIPKKKV